MFYYLSALTSYYGLVTRSQSSLVFFQAFSQSGSAELAESDEAQELLHFWLVFAAITGGESYLEFAVSWFPLYYAAKLALLWYIILPSTQGATLIVKHLSRVQDPKSQAKFAALLRASLTSPPKRLSDAQLGVEVEAAKRVLHALQKEEFSRRQHASQKEEDFVQVTRPSFFPTRGLPPPKNSTLPVAKEEPGAVWNLSSLTPRRWWGAEEATTKTAAAAPAADEVRVEEVQSMIGRLIWSYYTSIPAAPGLVAGVAATTTTTTPVGSPSSAEAKPQSGWFSSVWPLAQKQE